MAKKILSAALMGFFVLSFLMPVLLVGKGAPGDGGGQPGNNTFEIKPPGGYDNLVDLVKAIGRFIFNLAIPVAVILIIWVGIKFMTAQGETTKITEARKMLLWIVVGLAIIFIGQGFVTLIQSILKLG